MALRQTIGKQTDRNSYNQQNVLWSLKLFRESLYQFKKNIYNFYQKTQKEKSVNLSIYQQLNNLGMLKIIFYMALFTELIGKYFRKRENLVL